MTRATLAGLVVLVAGCGDAVEVNANPCADLEPIGEACTSPTTVARFPDGSVEVRLNTNESELVTVVEDGVQCAVTRFSCNIVTCVFPPGTPDMSDADFIHQCERLQSLSQAE